MGFMYLNTLFCIKISNLCVGTVGARGIKKPYPLLLSPKLFLSGLPQLSQKKFTTAIHNANVKQFYNETKGLNNNNRVQL